MVASRTGETSAGRSTPRPPLTTRKKRQSISADPIGGEAPQADFAATLEHGWTFAIVQADGRTYADAVETSHGCTFIGMAPNDLSCVVEVVTPRHVRLTVKQGATIRRLGDIELLEDGTTQTTHHVTPSQGAPYVEKTIWEKQVRK